ncbi:hypothetical protein ACMFMF_005612 [Clarireedia jacksonii]
MHHTCMLKYPHKQPTMQTLRRMPKPSYAYHTAHLVQNCLSGEGDITFGDDLYCKHDSIGTKRSKPFALIIPYLLPLSLQTLHHIYPQAQRGTVEVEMCHAICPFPQRIDLVLSHR